MGARTASRSLAAVILVIMAAALGTALPSVAVAETGEVPEVGTVSVQRVQKTLGVFRGSDQTTYTGVTCVSPAVAWVSGLNGTILRTSDGGRTWTRLSSYPLPRDEEVSDIAFVSATTGWAIGVNNAILRSTDSGASWKSQAFAGSLYPPYLLALSALDPTHAWIGGYYKLGFNDYVNVVLSTADGTHWQMSGDLVGDGSSGDWGVTGIDFPDRLHGWGSIMGGAFIRSDDGGSMWAGPLDIDQATTLEDVSFADATHGWAVGQDSSYDGFIMHTSDGVDWYRQAGDLTLPDVRAVCAVSQNVAWAACSGGYMLKTVNGGASWDAYHADGITSDLNAIACASPDIAWAVGYDGVILRSGPDYVAPKPTLSALKPASGKVRSAVTLSGHDFGALRDAKCFVTFGAKKATVKGWSDTRIKVTVPSGIPKGYVKVKVTTAGGTSGAKKFLRK